MEYQIRPLAAHDIPAMCKIITAFGIKEFRGCFEGEGIARIAAKGGVQDSDYAAAGAGVFFDLASVILANLPKCYDDVLEFLASISTLTKEEINGMELAAFTQLIVDVFQKPEFKDFIGVVSRLLK